MTETATNPATATPCCCDITRERLRKRLLATLDRSLAAPQDLSASDKAIIVALRAAVAQSVANEFLDVAIAELARRS